MKEPDKEHSAGGVILEAGRVLLIRMRNLRGEEVWTFPKGHLDPGETAPQAAVREVLEETGWRCEILGDLCTARYSFNRDGRPVNKDVRWFLMERAGGDGKPTTPDEVLATRWAALDEAQLLLSYASDLQLVRLLKKL